MAMGVSRFYPHANHRRHRCLRELNDPITWLRDDGAQMVGGDFPIDAERKRRERRA